MLVYVTGKYVADCLVKTQKASSSNRTELLQSDESPSQYNQLQLNCMRECGRLRENKRGGGGQIRTVSDSVFVIHVYVNVHACICKQEVSKWKNRETNSFIESFLERKGEL